MYNPFSLDGKRVLVTGASSGIGRAVAVECSRMGASLVITGRNAERLDETLRTLQGEGHVKVEADLTSPEGVEKVVAALPDSLDGVVHCAGIALPKPFRFYSSDEIKKVMGINFDAPALLTGELLRGKAIAKNGSLVFISSINGPVVSTVGNSVYSASKGALSGLVKGLALEMAPRGVRVNSILPGMVDTPILSPNGEISQEQLVEEAAKYPLGRYGKPEEVAWAVIYLLSDASRWVTGTNMVIDGGFTMK